ncbi:MAG: hypothetical protein JXR58_03355 [Bacteroidales bacterium]|nr:hypothetical protein [Bacteroidales bacterium]
MKIISILALVLAVFSAFSQTYDEKLAYVRKHYALIEKNLENYSEREYIYQPDSNYAPYAYYKFWYYEDGHLAKAERTMGEEGYYTEESFYYADGKFIFYFEHSEEPVWTEEGEMNHDIYESRAYFYDEIMFEYFTKELKSTENKDISEIANQKYKWTETDQSNLIESAADAVDFSSKAILNNN